MEFWHHPVNRATSTRSGIEMSVPAWQKTTRSSGLSSATGVICCDYKAENNCRLPRAYVHSQHTLHQITVYQLERQLRFHGHSTMKGHRDRLQSMQLTYDFTHFWSLPSSWTYWYAKLVCFCKWNFDIELIWYRIASVNPNQATIWIPNVHPSVRREPGCAHSSLCCTQPRFIKWCVKWSRVWDLFLEKTIIVYFEISSLVPGYRRARHVILIFAHPNVKLSHNSSTVSFYAICKHHYLQY